MLKKYLFVFIVSIITFVYAVPNQINYRGKLFESGNPVNGTRNMEFRIYNAQTGGIQLWTSGVKVLNINQGIYNFTMGTNPQIPVSVFTNDFTYLEVLVAGTPLVPRERFVSVPYAYKAEVMKGSNLIQASGNVGIGKNNPNAKFEVKGKSIFDGKVGIGNTNDIYDFTVMGGDFLGRNARTLLSVNDGMNAGYSADLTIDSDPLGGGSSAGLFMRNNGVMGAMLQSLPTEYSFVSGSFMVGTNMSPSEKLEVKGRMKADRIVLSSNAGAGRVLTSDATGLASWATPATGIGGSGTLNYLPRFTGTGTTIGNSLFYDTGTQIGLGVLSPRAGSLIHVEKKDGVAKIGILSVVSNTATADNENIAILGYGNANYVSGGYGYPVGVMGIANNTAAYMRAYGVYAGLHPSIPALTTLPQVKTALMANGNFASYAGLFMNGNVGVGTISPYKPLDVVGSARIAANTTPVFIVSNTATSAVSHFFDASGNTWLKSGNLGIGLTSPTSPLHIEKTGAWEPMILAKSPNDDVSIRIDSQFAGGGESYLEIANNLTGANAWGIGLNDSKILQFGYGPLGTMNKTWWGMSVKTNGFVGVGTTDPLEAFEAFNVPISLSYDDTAASSARILFRERNPGYDYKWAIIASADSYGTLEEQNAIGFFQFNKKTGAALNLYRFLITDDGYVGIGTSAPAEQLEITGNFRMPATTVAAGSLFFGTSRFMHGFGTGNTFLGLLAGNVTLSGSQNVGIGASALAALTTGGWNTVMGAGAGDSLTTGGYNTLIGRNAGTGLLTTSYNTFLGYNAGYAGTGLNNTAVGAQAGYNANGTGNVFIGYNAGYNETGSGFLYIDNSNTTTPLFWGDFTANIANINGRLGIGTETPAQQLHVQSNVAANDYLYHASKTAYARIPAAAFIPAGTPQPSYSTNGYWLSPTSTTNFVMHAPLDNVPNGAYVTSIIFYTYSAAGTFAVRGALRRRAATDNSATEWFSGSTTAPSGYGSALSFVVNSVLDKANYDYIISFKSVSSSAYRFYGARVTYTMPSPGF